MNYEAMAASTKEAVDCFHKLPVELRETEAALSKATGLMAATVDYAKTWPVFDGYKAAKNSKNIWRNMRRSLPPMERPGPP